MPESRRVPVWLWHGGKKAFAAHLAWDPSACVVRVEGPSRALTRQMRLALLDRFEHPVTFRDGGPVGGRLSATTSVTLPPGSERYFAAVVHDLPYGLLVGPEPEQE